MNEYLIKGETLTDIADEVRELSGVTNGLTPSIITTNLNEVNSEVASQTELIEQIATALEGKASGNTNIKLQSKTVIPSSSELVITADKNFDGLKEVTVQGDEDLVPENIKDGVNIFGVQGSLSTSGGGSSNLGEKIITSNGEYYAEDDGYDGYNYVDVSVAAELAVVRFDVRRLPDEEYMVVVYYFDNYLSAQDACFMNIFPIDGCVIEVAKNSIIGFYCDDLTYTPTVTSTDDIHIYSEFSESKYHIARINGDGTIYVS